MTKRASGKFERNPRDFYPTPRAAMDPLLRHLSILGPFSFAEPCAGNGDMVQHLEAFGHSCVYASDIRHGDDALLWKCPEDAEYIITNPPWRRDILHPMIEHFSSMEETWLLFDSDWMHTKQAIPYLEYCHAIVSVGRVSWMGNGVAGFDNAAWYNFGPTPASGGTVFFGR